MQKVTAIITCFNEEQHIEAVLKSVQWCDEIIVVDSFSTDSTLEKAALFNTRILHHEYENPAKQKTGLYHKLQMNGFYYWMRMKE